MNGKIKGNVEPIKVQVIPIGAVEAGAPASTGTRVLRLTCPSRRIHFIVNVGWYLPGTTNPDISGSMDVYPMMKDPSYGSQLIRMQPVASNLVLPAGYEAESGVKDWEVELDFDSIDVDPGRIFATVIWEPSLVDMCEEEHAYWAGLCNAQLVGEQLRIGGSE